jgi:hypothetical protein
MSRNIFELMYHRHKLLDNIKSHGVSSAPVTRGINVRLL